MQVLIAPDSFKETLTGEAAASAMADGVRDIWPNATCVLLPLSDGGEGFGETVALAWEAAGEPIEWVGAHVRGPRSDMPPLAWVRARYAVSGPRAVLESATAVGLGLLPPELRNPLQTTTLGVGDLLRAALDDGASDIVLGLGGTCTVDGGAGLLVSLGARLLGSDGTELPPLPAHLPDVTKVDLTRLDPRLESVRLRVACDVTNPLLGEHGAAFVYGPQKGATVQDLVTLEAALSHWADLLDPNGTRRNLPGVGAAGGLSFALQILGAEPVPGAELVAELVDLNGHIAQADVILTGEGRFDAQTLQGKIPGLVAARAAQQGKPVYGVCGTTGDGADALTDVFTAIECITPEGSSREEAFRHAAANLRAATARALTRWCCFA